MKKFFILAGLAALTVVSAQAATPIHLMVYNVDDAHQCSVAGTGQLSNKEQLASCNTALSDPLMTNRATLLLDRGVVFARMGDKDGALRDYNAAIALSPQLGEAYVSRAALFIDLKRYDEARSDVATGISLGASDMYAAYYNRGVIAEETGNPQAAYADYKRALAIKPDFFPAMREISRFKVVQRDARM